MQNSNQSNQNTQDQDQAKKGDSTNSQNQQNRESQQQGGQKDSAWRGSSPEDTTGKQAGQTNQGTQAKQPNQAGQGNSGNQDSQGKQANQSGQSGQGKQPTMEHGRQEQDRSMNQGKTEQGNPNNAMGNAANNRHEQNKDQKKYADQMGSRKRQDDN